MCISSAPITRTHLPENYIEKSNVPFQVEQIDERMNPILELHLNRNLANIVIEYATSNALEDLIKNASLPRIKTLFLLGNFPNIQLPAVYSCMIAAIFGQGDILRWLLASRYLKKEMASKSLYLMEKLYCSIVSCANHAGHTHILSVLCDFPVEGTDLNSREQIIQLSVKRKQNNQHIRENLIISKKYKELSAHLQQILTTNKGYDGHPEYISFSGWDVFALRRDGFSTLANLLVPNFYQYHLHKKYLDQAIYLLDNPPKKRKFSFPCCGDDIKVYLQFNNMFHIIENDLDLLNSREALKEFLATRHGDYFAKKAIQENVSNEELFNACLKDYVLDLLDRAAS